MKIVINVRHGGFGLSDLAIKEIHELRAKPSVEPVFHTDDEFGGDDADLYNIARNDPHLIAVVEKLGSQANGDHSQLKVVEIPDDVEWVIEEYVGAEWIAEKHRTWR